MPGANSSQELKTFFSWLSIFFKNRDLQFTRCGFKGGDDLGNHAIDLDTGFWENPPYSTSKPPRWIFHVNKAGNGATAEHPEDYESIHIGYSNTGGGDKSGLAVRIVPLLSGPHGGLWTKRDDFEVVALFIFPDAVEPGGAAEPFGFEPNSGEMTYKGRTLAYVFGGLLGLKPDAEAVAVAGATITYGEVLQALSSVITVNMVDGSHRAPVYNLTEPTQIEALKQAITHSFEQGQALLPAAAEPNAGTMADAEEDEIRSLPDVLPILEDPDLIGIDASVYQQINAALASGKQHLMFYGPPGTGKTTLARWVATALAGSKWLLLTGSADWGSQDVIGGYQPLGGDKMAFQPGVLLRHFDRPLIIDELNRCDIDKVLGPLFTVLSGHQTSLPHQVDVADKNSPQYIILPEPKAHKAEHEFAPEAGWRLIATINSIDKASLFQMSYALARRFGWIYLDAPRDLKRFLRDLITRRDGVAPPDGPCPLAEIWEAINRVRVIGPAPILDAVNIIEVLTPGMSLFGEVNPGLRNAILDAFDMVMLPMLDGLTLRDASQIADTVVASLRLDGAEKERIEARLVSAAV